MIALSVALLAAAAAGLAGWRIAVARRRDGPAAAPASPPPATPAGAAPHRPAIDHASARAKAERVIAAEAARRKAEQQKAENAARARAEREAAEAARAAAALASTLPSPRLPRPPRTARIPDAERTAPIDRPAVEPGPPTALERTQPLVRPPVAVRRAPAAAAVHKTAAQTLVMLVDDSKMVRVKSGRLLAAHGFRVVTAVDGIDALKQLETCSPDLVITDVDMPGMDGFGLVNALRRDPRTRHVPLVMITSAQEQHLAEARRVGVGLVLGKPYDEAALVAHINSFEFLAPAAQAPAPAFA